ncbi:hypothetical protein EDB85DRAFT_1868559 [Lactarius pseudohatsudake]|nr:hypothetical protein EDB85DRAFT_1868559 [Lactarius pseudohatsudake]
MTHLLIILFSLFHYGRAQQTLIPFTIPLAVRSPYFNCWGFTDFGQTNIMTGYYDGDRSILDINVHVRVDNKTFVLLGYTAFESWLTQANVTSVVVSPTQSTLSAKAGHMQINLTFLNPIEPGDWVKQSIPLSYMTLTATSLDGVAHSVQVYSDLGTYWLSGNESQELLWTGFGDDSVIGHQVKRQNPTLSSRVSSDTDWGTLHHFMKTSDNITWKVDERSVSRRSFMLKGVLEDPEVALQWDAGWNYLIPNLTVFAMSRDLGTIQATQDPVIWVVGYTTDPVIGYTDLSGTSQLRRPVYKVKYPDDRFLIVAFMNDFANAASRARKLDQKILQEAVPISGPLGDLVSLATAQVYGSTQLASATSASGGLNNSDVMAFMKNINGMPLERNRVNPVETLYSAFPAFMYIDPDLGGLLLEPLFRLQASPKYTNPYAAPDLAEEWKVCASLAAEDLHIADQSQESGNMLIMTCAHARASGDRNLISKYYDLLTSWADYLSDSTLLIHNQYSAEGRSTDNQTNLAIKGIIAIKAMSQMSSFVNKTTDFDKYSNSSSRLYAQWKDLALAGDKHLLAAYGKMGSWTLGYNLFADVWLNTSIIEPSVYNSQSSFVQNISLHQASGLLVPVDDLSTDTNVNLGWNLFMAAMTPDHGLRTNLISAVHRRLFVYLQHQGYELLEVK